MYYSGFMDSSAQSPIRSTPSPLTWVSLVFDLYENVNHIIQHFFPSGLYEMLEYDSVLELIDPKGKIALFKKRQRVRFLQDNVIAFQDYAWGDGELLEEYRCSPGVEVDHYKEGDRWNVLISLRQTKSRADVEDFYIERKINGGFTKREEWWQIEMRHQTDHLKVNIIFPRKRRCKSAVLIERNRNRSTPLGSTHFTELPDGREALTWETRSPRRFETYTIKWRW
jgi:hypothetical protein